MNITLDNRKLLVRTSSYIQGEFDRTTVGVLLRPIIWYYIYYTHVAQANILAKSRLSLF